MAGRLRSGVAGTSPSAIGLAEHRVSSFIPPVVKSPRPAKAELLPGTLAYWRFDAGGANGTPVTASQTIKDLSGHGNDLNVLNTMQGSAAEALTWSSDFYPNQPGHGSLLFKGGQNPLHGAHLTTAANAPLNTETFTNDFTIETFVKIPSIGTPTTIRGTRCSAAGAKAAKRARAAATPTRRSPSSRSASLTAASRSASSTRRTRPVRRHFGGQGLPEDTSQVAGMAGQVEKVNVTNTGTQPLRISGASIASTDSPAAFSIKHDNCCGPGATAASCRYGSPRRRRT